ncbi:MAG: hypothetical protein KDA83_02060 [Planctomycetales bacterium]|nr:hypothetical protein [Planctomycetales bacterium]
MTHPRRLRANSLLDVARRVDGVSPFVVGESERDGSTPRRPRRFSYSLPAELATVPRVWSPTLRAAFVLALVGLFWGLTAKVTRADTIVLRDFTTLEDVTIARIDEQGVQLVGSRRLGWGEIRYGEVSGDQQADFDRWLNEFGPTLYRLRYRLDLRDDGGAGPIAESLADSFGDSSSTAGQLVQLGLYRFHLSQGERAHALAAWLALQRPFDSAQDPRSPRFSWPQTKSDGLWDPQLPPVWFDTEEAAKALPIVVAELERLPNPSPACRLYVASLALAVGDRSLAQEQLRLSNPATPGQQDWLSVIRLQESRAAGQAGERIASLDQRIDQMEPQLQSLARYELGLAKISVGSAASVPRGLIELLRVPAEQGDLAPEIAAAALWRAALTMQGLEQASAAARVRNELMRQFPETWHGQALRDGRITLAP